MNFITSRCLDLPGEHLKEVVEQYITDGFIKVFGDPKDIEWCANKEKQTNMNNVIISQKFNLLSNVMLDLQIYLGNSKKLYFEHWYDFWTKVFPFDQSESIQQLDSCRIMIHDDGAAPQQPGEIQYEKEESSSKGKKGGNKKKGDRIFSLKCYKASVCFKKIMEEEPHSLILASGTLSPLENIEEELGIKFEVKETFKHVIDDSQLKIQTIAGFNNQSFNFIYNQSP